MLKTWIAVAACLTLLGCATSDGGYAHLDASSQQPSSGGSFGYTGAYGGGNGAFTSLPNH